MKKDSPIFHIDNCFLFIYSQLKTNFVKFHNKKWKVEKICMVLLIWNEFVANW